MKKNNRNQGPRRKRLSRSGRLQAGKIFIEQYSGKNLVAGYGKWFAVSFLCATLELKMLGQDISDAVIERYQNGEVNKADWRRIKKGKETEKEEMEVSRSGMPDEYQAFLYGFMSTEVPLGITWEGGAKGKIGKKKMHKGKANSLITGTKDGERFA